MNRRKALMLLVACGLTLPLSLSGLSLACQSKHHALPSGPTVEVKSQRQVITVQQATNTAGSTESRTYSGLQGSQLVKINDHYSERLYFTVNGFGLYSQGSAGQISAMTFTVKNGDTVEWFDLGTNALIVRLKIV